MSRRTIHDAIDVPRAALVASAIFARAKHKAGVRGFAMEVWPGPRWVELRFVRDGDRWDEYRFSLALDHDTLLASKDPEYLATVAIARAWQNFLRTADCWAITDYIRSLPS